MGCSLAAAAILAALAGCSSPGAGPPQLLRAAAAQTRAGEEAYLSGRAGEAIPFLAESARLHLAAGDHAGAVRALLNQALAERAAGKPAAAALTADRLRELTPAAQQQLRELGGRDGAAKELSAATLWLDALCARDRGDRASAESALARADGKYPGSSPWPGRLETLRAELALDAGHFSLALVHARTGRAAAEAAGDKAEEARARRLSGSSQLKVGALTEARVDFLDAVRLETALGGGARMAGDLRQLAAIAERLGDPSGAQLYTQRAAAIDSARSSASSP